MDRLSRDEVYAYVEKIRMGLGSDEEVEKWIGEISASVPNRNITRTIMLGTGITTHYNKIYLFGKNK